MRLRSETFLLYQLLFFAEGGFVCVNDMSKYCYNVLFV